MPPYDWALDQMRVAEAHAVTRGSRDVIVAVIDIAYYYHPDHAGHLWVNPRPLRGNVHGWDFDQVDATLEYEGPPYDATKPYYRDHGSFLVGEIAAVAPDCRIMTLRAAYNPTNQGGWVRAIDYAVAHGACVIVLSHCYIATNRETGESLFHQGTDFTYPTENPALIDAFDHAYDAGCLIFRGAGDNRGRRVVSPIAAVDSAIPVGSTNRHGRAASIAPATAYTEFAAPCGEGTDDPRDTIWGTGGNGTETGYKEMQKEIRAGIAPRDLNTVWAATVLKHNALPVYAAPISWMAPGRGRYKQPDSVLVRGPEIVEEGLVYRVDYSAVAGG